ncbi:MAG: PQQ-binding-like beta-propeller repeat protein, partial [Planctomycetes bacterium]|nr:PQQ-binding-like beta-propeller repeat protein [Planctomycetota bacterium]
STVYVASHLSGRMAALNGADGRKGWDFRVDGTPRRAPVLTQGLSRQLLIFGTDEGQIVAIDAKSAHDSAPSNAAWTKPLNGPVSGDLTFGWIAGEEEGEGYGLIVVPCEDGWLYGIDPATGRSRWVVRSDATFRGPAKIIGNRVYATNRDRMFCIDADTGHRIWYPASTAGLSEFEKNEFFGPPEGYEHAERVLADDGTRAFFTRGHSVIMRCASSDGSIESEYAMSAFDFFMTNTVTGDLLLGTKDGYLFSFK